MIKFTQDKNDILWAASLQPILCSRIYTLFKAYKNDFPFFKCYTILDEAGNIIGVLGIQGGSAYLVASESADLYETELFLTATPFMSIEVNYPIKAFVKELLKKEGVGTFVMRNTSPSLHISTSDTMIEKGVPKEVYSLICKSFPDFEENNPYPSWLYDTHRKVACGAANIYTLKAEGFSAATGGYYSSTPEIALIASIATHPVYRGRGYASQMLAFLGEKLHSEGKTPHLIAAEESLIGYYEKQGYELCSPTVIFEV